MFTGIIQTTGAISAYHPQNGDLRMTISAPNLGLADVAIGDSIAVNGVCLTAISLSEHAFDVQVSAATLAVTVGFSQHQSVNLEKALRLSDRLGGHLVSGHVDGVGVVTQLEARGDHWFLAIQAPHALSQFIAQKGSICVNGVSLTVNHIAQDTFDVNLIPHTWQHTNLHQLSVGSRVNLEIDQIARYVARMADWAQGK